RFLENLQGQHNVVVLAGRCYERESVPYKALDILVDALSRYLRRLPDVALLMPRDVSALARLFPVLLDVAPIPPEASEAPDPQELRRRAFAALRELLVRLGEQQGLLLYIDDLQWGDTDSAALLADLLRPPEAPVLCLICSYRSEYATTSPCLKALGEIRDVALGTIDWRELSVEPLSHVETTNLARQLMGPGDRDPDDWVEAIARESAGSPYLVHELVQYIQTGAVLARQASGTRITLDEV